MVRTLADGGSKKAVASKAPRKNLGGGGSSNVYCGSPSSNNPNFGLSNHAKMWPTPTWQKGINNFFKKCDKPAEEEASSLTCASEECERMEADDVVVVTESSSSNNTGAAGTSSSNNDRMCSDEEDKENIDPSSSPEDLAPAIKNTDGRSDEASGRSDSGSPSPKPRRKASGKQKAPPCKKKKRMVLQEDSDYDDE